ncbi:hypothetical protein ANN_22745 [Periplaneta americana]|uniref:Uncharacterized protein n=1 Tax=Periplaneta americana TaxID=6978 RepID=A0ABQ8SKJ9_PERAM|nr:hypothetical protein ANN_22745 [Periplaneta americana]
MAAYCAATCDGANRHATPHPPRVVTRDTTTSLASRCLAGFNRLFCCTRSQLLFYTLLQAKETNEKGNLEDGKEKVASKK